MSGPPERREVVGAWVTKAEHDLRAAEHLLTLGAACPCDVVCFHAQQCAEKYLKVLLVEHGIDPPRSHDLTELWPLLPTPVAVEIGELAELNPYAVSARYPLPAQEPGREEAARAVQIARRVRDSVRAALALDAPS